MGCRTLWSIAGSAILVGVACTADDDSLAAIVEPEASSTTAAVAAARAERTIEISLPPVPPVVVPDLSVLDETGELVQESIGELITPVSGVDLVSANCAEDDGELIYEGSTGSDVFDIGADGSGEYYDERDFGVVSLVVDGSGGGQFYDSSRGGVISIKVEGDGSGEYYNEQSNGLVTIRVGPDGSGDYYDDRDGGLVTIHLDDDGGAEYYREGDDGLLTIDVSGDGTAAYYHDSPTAGLTTLQANPDGSWRLTRTTTSRSIDLIVEPDGSGTYVEGGPTPAEFAFGSDGRGDGNAIVIPSGPAFVVNGAFPPLGELGSLAPRCATVIRFSTELLFDFNSAEIKQSADQVLVDVVAALNEAGKPVEINGHSDSIGDEEYNRELSIERAQAVEAALRERGLDVQADVNGYGEERPIADNETPDGADDPDGRALNRRVEIVIRDGEQSVAATG